MSLCILVVLVVAAPAPLLKPEVAEVSFDAGTPEAARLVGAYLRWRGAMAELANAPDVAERLGWMTRAERVAWLSSRLSVSVDGTAIVVRLEMRREAVRVLRVLTQVLLGSPPADDAEGQAKRRQALALREEFVRRVAQSRQIRVRVEERFIVEMEALAGKYELEAKPPKLRRAPHLAGR